VHLGVADWKSRKGENRRHPGSLATMAGRSERASSLQIAQSPVLRHSRAGAVVSSRHNKQGPSRQGHYCRVLAGHHSQNLVLTSRDCSPEVVPG